MPQPISEELNLDITAYITHLAHQMLGGEWSVTNKSINPAENSARFTLKSGQRNAHLTTTGTLTSHDTVIEDK